MQLDTISVLARSHELVAYARLGPVGRAAVEDAYWGEPARAFEYYAHANCILPLETWPYFSFRRQQLGRGVWPSLMKTNIIDEVRARLKDGPVTASDVGGARRRRVRLVELVRREARARSAVRARRSRLHDAAQLEARVRPAGARAAARTSAPRAVAGGVLSRISCAPRERRSASAPGVTSPRYFRLLELYLGRTLDRARLFDRSAGGERARRRRGRRLEGAGVSPIPPSLNARAPRTHRATLLSPFDSLVWERERTQRLFGYTFSLEAYKPKETRVHGYFTMPLLAGGRIAGHVDPAREGTHARRAQRLARMTPVAVDDVRVGAARSRLLGRLRRRPRRPRDAARRGRGAEARAGVNASSSVR